MSDWDFLHDMHNEGYSPDQIADAAACGYNPYDSLNFECLGFSSDEWEELDDSELAEETLSNNPELSKVFNNLVYNAKLFHSLTNRYLQIWGELGELFGEIHYGIKRHKPHTKGSDGAYSHAWRSLNNIHADHVITSMPITQ